MLTSSIDNTYTHNTDNGLLSSTHQINISKGQCLILNSKIVFAENTSAKSHCEKVLLGSSMTYPITHISIYVYIGHGSSNVIKNQQICLT